MELYQLEQFVAICECGSMSLAAERLYLSRSALSQNLKHLERELDCELFTRRRNKLEITPCGEILLQHSRAVMQELIVAHDEIAREKRSNESVLRIAHFSQPVSYFKLPHLAQSMPQYSFAVDVCNEESACSGVLSGDYDLAFVPMSSALPKGLKVFVLEEERACLSVPRGSQLYGREEVSLSEIEDVELLVTDNMPGVSEWYKEMAGHTNVAAQDILTVPADQYLATMSESDAVHFSTTHMVNFFGLGDGRRAVQITDDIASRELVLIAKDLSDPRIVDVLGYLEREKQNSFDAYDIFPFLVFPGQISNLELNLV